MAKLTTKKRNDLPKSDFAGPGRSYPVPDRSHAANAKARASQAVNAGRMSKPEEAKIDAKADKVLGKKSAPKTNGGLTADEHRAEAERLRGEAHKRHGMADVHEARARVLEAKQGVMPSTGISIASIPMARAR